MKGPSWSIFPLFATRLFRNYPLVSPLVFAENPEKPSFPQLRLRPKLGRFEIPLFGGFASPPVPARARPVSRWASTVHLSVRPYFLGVCVPLPGFQCMLDPGLCAVARARRPKVEIFPRFSTISAKTAGNQCIPEIPHFRHFHEGAGFLLTFLKTRIFADFSRGVHAEFARISPPWGKPEGCAPCAPEFPGFCADFADFRKFVTVHAHRALCSRSKPGFHRQGSCHRPGHSPDRPAHSTPDFESSHECTHFALMFLPCCPFSPARIVSPTPFSAPLPRARTRILSVLQESPLNARISAFRDSHPAGSARSSRPA